MRVTALIAFVLALLAGAAPAAAKTPFDGIHAHRGGPLTGGTLSNYENSLEAFEAADALGADVIELDVKLTSDNVPVVMHDETLDRTTNCTGAVRAKTAAELTACRIDIVGTGSAFRERLPGVAIPTLAAVLDLAKREQLRLNLEIKNQPTDTQDYDSTPAFADTVLGAIESSGIRKANVVIQSFWPPNLDRAELRGFTTSLLVVSAVATQENLRLAQPYDFVSPGWPVQGDPKAYVDAAHRMGKPVVPYTLDTRKDIQAALDAGVDGLITNDPKLGLLLLYRPICREAQGVEKRALKKYRKAKTDGARKKARKQYLKDKRARKAACARVPA